MVAWGIAPGIETVTTLLAEGHIHGTWGYVMSPLRGEEDTAEDGLVVRRSNCNFAT